MAVKKKATPKKKGPGRPAYEVTPEVIKKTEQLAAQGLTLEQITMVLGISHQTFNEKRKEYPELVEAIKRGKAKGVATISNKLFQKASEGDNTSMIFFLKNRDPDNWKDVQRHAGENSEDIKVTKKVTREIVDKSNDTDS